MEKRGLGEMDTVPPPQPPRSHVKLLKTNRELLVTHIRNTQCLVDNLLENDYFSAEDAEIVGACPTQPDKVPRTGDGGRGTEGGGEKKRGGKGRWPWQDAMYIGQNWPPQPFLEFKGLRDGLITQSRVVPLCFCRMQPLTPLLAMSTGPPPAHS